MCLQVILESTSLPCPVVAEVALVRLLARVHPHVSRQIRIAHKPLATRGAFKVFLLSVALFMVAFGGGVGELLPAEATLELTSVCKLKRGGIRRRNRDRLLIRNRRNVPPVYHFFVLLLLDRILRSVDIFNGFRFHQSFHQS